MTTYLDSSVRPLTSVSSERYEHFYCGGTDTVTTHVDNLNIASDLPKQRTVVISDVTPDFHKRLKEGKLIPFTRHHVRGEEVVNAPSLGTCVDPVDPPEPSWLGGCGGWSEDVGQPCLAVQSCYAELPDPPAAVDFNPMLTEALGEAKSGALLILLELAEAPKLVELFKGFNHRLNRRRRAIHRQVKKRYNPQTITEFNRVFSDAWLEYRYGWRQLYYSSVDLVDAINVLKNEKWFVVNTGRSFNSQSVPANVFNVTLGNTGHYGNSTVVNKSATITREQRAIVSLQVHKGLAALDVNPVALAWELIPYSFVVDWFVNLGDIARAVWPVPYVERTAATSTKYVERAVVDVKRDPPVYGRWSSTVGRYQHTREEYVRTPFTGDIPLTFNVDVRLGLSNILDIVALATGVHKRHKQNPLRI